MRFETTLTPEQIERYSRSGLWREETLDDYLRAAARRHPQKLAVVDWHRRLTFGQLDQQASRVAVALSRLGIAAGDVVSLQLPNWAELVVAHLALTKLGAVTNPVLPIYRHRELDFMLGLAESKAIVVPNRFRGFDYPSLIAGLRPELPCLQHVIVVGDAPQGTIGFDDLVSSTPEPESTPSLVRPRANDVTILLFTSGTVANKGVMHTHNTSLFDARMFVAALGLTGDDVAFMPSPLAHATGLQFGLRVAMLLGATVVLQDVWRPAEAAELIEREQATYSVGATPFVHDLVTLPGVERHDLSSFRLFPCGGAPIPRELGLEAKRRLGCTLLGCFGMSEHFISTLARAGDPEHKQFGTDGRPLDHVEIAIFDDERRHQLPAGKQGELAIRGPNVAVGYLKNPEATRDTFREDGWQFSDDLATRDDTGYVRIVGRKKDMIIRGGTNVSPAEIEDLLFGHPKIDKVAVVGMPDARLGEKTCAYVVPRAGVVVELGELVDYLTRRGLAPFKLPERLELIDALPATPSGKVRKHVLREEIRRTLAAEASATTPP